MKTLQYKISLPQSSAKNRDLGLSSWQLGGILPAYLKVYFTILTYLCEQNRRNFSRNFRSVPAFCNQNNSSVSLYPVCVKGSESVSHQIGHWRTRNAWKMTVQCRQVYKQCILLNHNKYQRQLIHPKLILSAMRAAQTRQEVLQDKIVQCNFQQCNVTSITISAMDQNN